MTLTATPIPTKQQAISKQLTEILHQVEEMRMQFRDTQAEFWVLDLLWEVVRFADDFITHRRWLLFNRIENAMRALFPFRP